MKTKLLKKIKARYRFKYKDGKWVIFKRNNSPIAYCETTHKALHIMASDVLGIQHLFDWQRKVSMLHGDWGDYGFYMPLYNDNHEETFY